jgi:ADP-heptose:LPS heptosyltransferase
MCLPIVTALRRRDPEVRISWLCGEALAPLVELMGDIEVIRVNEGKLMSGSVLDKSFEVMRLWRRFFGRSFDLIITGYMGFWSRLLTLTTIAKERRKCAPRTEGWWAVAGRYQGDEYLRLVTKGDGPTMEPAELPTFRIPLSDQMRALLGDSRKPLVAIAPGGAKNVLVESPLRRWPLGFYRLLAESLLERGYEVVVTGGPADSWVSQGFAGLDLINVVGQTSLIDLLAVYGASAGVVTHDSGPLHMAMLAGTPTVALFGPTMPRHFVPKGKPVTVLWGGKDLPCRPCYDGKRYAPCSDNLCMKQISVAEVVKALEDIVDLHGTCVPLSTSMSRQLNSRRD